MPSSVREQILAALKATLEGIEGVGDVSRGKIDAVDVQRYPAAFVVPGTDTPTNLLTNTIDRTWEIFLFLWIKSQLDISATLEVFLAQIKQAMTADRTLGGIAIDIGEGATHEPMPLNEEFTEAAVILEYQIRYRTPRGDPYTVG